LAKKFESNLIKELQETAGKLDGLQKLDDGNRLLIAELIKSIPDIADKIAKECKVQSVAIDWEKMPESKAFPEIFKIDWSDMPKPDPFPEKIIIGNQIKEVEISRPIIGAIRAIPQSLVGIGQILQNLFNRLVDLIREPDEVILNDDSIVEYYGNRKVEYSLTYEGKKLKRIQRNESK